MAAQTGLRDVAVPPRPVSAGRGQPCGPAAAPSASEPVPYSPQKEPELFLAQGPLVRPARPPLGADARPASLAAQRLGELPRGHGLLWANGQSDRQPGRGPERSPGGGARLEGEVARGGCRCCAPGRWLCGCRQGARGREGAAGPALQGGKGGSRCRATPLPPVPRAPGRSSAGAGASWPRHGLSLLRTTGPRGFATD